MKRLAVLTIAVLALAGCTAKVGEVNTPSSSSPSTKAAVTATTTPVAHVGATLVLPGLNESVALAAVADPATPHQYVTTDPGKRFVGATFVITNTGSTPWQGNANANTTLVGSDGQTYTADFNPLADCTNFASGNYQLGGGESSTGCVAFQVPTGVTVAKVKFSPGGGYGAVFGEWLVP